MDDASSNQKSRRSSQHPNHTPAVNSPPRSCLSYEDLSDQTGISVSTLRRRVKEGKLPFIQPGGRRTRVVFPADVVELLLQHRANSSEAEPVSPSAQPERLAAASAHHGPKPKWRRGE